MSKINNSLNDPKRRKRRLALCCVKKLSALLREKGDFYCFNCRCYFATKNKLNSHEKVCKNNDFCRIVMPFEKNNILQFNQNMTSDKIPYITYADPEPLIKKIDGYQTNLHQHK